MPRERGYFITFDGPDGSGKSTCLKRVTDHFQREYDLYMTVTREPGGTNIGDEIRRLVHSLAHVDMFDRAELLLYSGSRAQLVDQVISPSLDEGKVVFSDRFTDATLAYQGYGRGIDIAALQLLNQFATNDISPDLTVIFDVDPQIGIDRRSTDTNQWNRMDAQALAFHQRVRDGYLAIAQTDLNRYIVVDASRGEDEVFAEVVTIVENRLVAVGLLGTASGNSILAV